MPDRLYPQRVDGGRNPAGAPYEAPVGYTWQRDVLQVQLHRDGEGLSTFDPLIGDTAHVDDLVYQWGADLPDIANGSSYDATCKENYVVPLERGMWRENIVWEWMSEWTEVEASSDSPIS